MEIFQRKIRLRPCSRGFHLITKVLLDSIPEIGAFQVGIMNVFLQHTSASLTINENADPSVRRDCETFFSDLAKDGDKRFEHSDEGPDDMPSHIKSCILGSSLSIPIEKGRLALGTWQGIYLCEHRNNAGSRNVVVTIMGEQECSKR